MFNTRSNTIPNISLWHNGLDNRVSFLEDETAFMLDLTGGPGPQSVATSTGGTPTYYGIDDLLVDTVTPVVPVMLRDASGNLFWVAHNLYLNSSAPATQTRTVVSGAQYTVSVTGTGSLALTGATTATVTAGNPVTFTASTTSLVSTKTGTLNTMQLNRGPVATAYLATTAAARQGVPVGYSAADGKWALITQPQKTNSLLNSFVPATQTVSLTAASYILWVEGTGSCALSGGPTGTASAGSPVLFTLGGTTSVTFTVSGTLTFFQCEVGVVPTSHIETIGASGIRQRNQISVPLASLPALGSSWSMFTDFKPDVVTATGYLVSLTGAVGEATSLYLNSPNALVQVIDNNVSQANMVISATAPTFGSRNQFAASYQLNSFQGSLNGVPITINGVDQVGTMPTVTTLEIGASQTASQLNGQLKTFRVLVVPGVVPSADLATWKYQGLSTDSTIGYDIIIDIGQSNCYWGNGFSAGTDVSSNSVDVINQSGTIVHPALEPMPYVGGVKASAIGHSHTFARDYYVPNKLTSGRRVLIVPGAQSGTGFGLPADTALDLIGHWAPGQTNIVSAASFAGWVLDKYPKSKVVAIFWQQGENEAYVGMTESTYASLMDTMINDLRAQFGATVPVVVGGMVPEWIRSFPIIPSWLSTVAAGGAGYTVGDTLTIVGGTKTTAATFKVATVDGTGSVTKVTIFRPGDPGGYTVLPSNPAATTGGTGAGCTINLDPSNCQHVADAHTNAPSRLTRCAYADPALPSELPGDTGANGIIHFTAAGQRTLAGRYWTAYQSIVG